MAGTEGTAVVATAAVMVAATAAEVIDMSGWRLFGEFGYEVGVASEGGSGGCSTEERFAKSANAMTSGI